MTDRDHLDPREPLHCPRCTGPMQPLPLIESAIVFFGDALVARRVQMAIGRPLRAYEVMQLYGVSFATAKRDIAAVRKFFVRQGKRWDPATPIRPPGSTRT